MSSESDIVERDTVVTLAENDFFQGVAVLLNSLLDSGFTGKFLVGTRGESASRDWFTEQAERLRSQNLLADITIIDIASEWHLANEKPRLISETFANDVSTARISYFDPDIVVACPWRFIHGWMDHGVAVAADVNYSMPAGHPIRKSWEALLLNSGRSVCRTFDLYFNSGFVGIRRDCLDFALHWQGLTEAYGAHNNPLDASGDIGDWRTGGRWQTVMSPNQDTMNMAAMACNSPVSPVGPDAMAFIQGDAYIPHAIGSSKPWRKRYLLDAALGKPPRTVDKHYWWHATGPIVAHSSLQTVAKKSAIKIASLAGRFYSRR